MQNPTPLPQPRARSEIHAKVQLMLAQLGPGDGKAALDAPLGRGAMEMHLLDCGYTVCGLDIDLEQSSNLPAAIKRTACNLNKELDLPNASFDLVTSLEGIEHVEN